MMKKIIIVLFAIMIAPSISFAKDFNFVWGTPALEPDGYYLYMDNQETPVRDDIPGDATTTSFPDPEDGKPHAFWIKAWIGNEVSGNSDVAVAVPEKTEIVGGFIITNVTTVTPKE